MSSSSSVLFVVGLFSLVLTTTAMSDKDCTGANPCTCDDADSACSLYCSSSVYSCLNIELVCNSGYDCFVYYDRHHTTL